ncbi:MAG: hypothetical protein ACPGOV_17225 [Magnetovibrionaceae bacterium]
MNSGTPPPQAATTGSQKRAPVASDDTRVNAALNRAVSELEAAVQETEKAAERILGIAELMIAHVDAPSQQRLIAIMEACSFQDLTGQRIRKVGRLIKYLRDTRQVSAAEIAGAAKAAAPPPPPQPTPPQPEGLTQEEVDRLLNGG